MGFDLQEPTHPDAGILLDISRGHDDSRILPSKFKSYWGEMLGSRKRNLGSYSNRHSYETKHDLARTLRPTISEPMNVMCLIQGDLVNTSASSG